MSEIVHHRKRGEYPWLRLGDSRDGRIVGRKPWQKGVEFESREESLSVSRSRRWDIIRMLIKKPSMSPLGHLLRMLI